MTRDEIIEMARQAGFDEWQSKVLFDHALEAFAKLVAEAEREACANLVEPTEEHRKEAQHYIGGEEGVELLDNLAVAIRARGQA
jgi:hypothetical protein